ncbi:MAG: hypothetical protein QY314_05055 [Candidatus Dojkabacteria bacterium]|nr:MAG: hypothetical protein QY314_05055 [Candidatus Dojkabacteria bacterium]
MKEKAKKKPLLTKEKVLKVLSQGLLLIFVLIIIFAMVALPLLQIL